MQNRSHGRGIVELGCYRGGLTVALALLCMAYFLPDSINDLVLRVIGLTSCLYAVLDIKSDILDRSEAMSDAHMLAEATGVPTVVWGVVWLIVAFAVTAYFVRKACIVTTGEADSAAMPIARQR